jgi:hypothetical protein
MYLVEGLSVRSIEVVVDVPQDGQGGRNGDEVRGKVTLVAGWTLRPTS